MKHICDENGCRLVSEEEYKKYLNSKEKEKNEILNGKKKPQKTSKNSEKPY